MKKIQLNKKIIFIIVAIAIIALLITILLMFPLSKKKTDSTAPSDTMQTTSSSSSTTSTSSSATSAVFSPTENINPDLVTAVDYAIAKLPLVGDNFSLFYSYEKVAFIAHINAQKDTPRAKTIKNKVNQWFTSQNVDPSTIKLEFVYR